MNDSRPDPSAPPTEDFDVFLNHRGPDVKATFVAHLEDALRHAGFRPFLDARSLMKGDSALQSIDQAVAVAKVHIAVVSKRYAESKYCLNELVAMVRSGKPVIPVFYDVEPVHLQLVEKGPFAEAFERHRSRGRTEKKLQEWTDALRALAEITGFCLGHYRWDEAKLKQDVVNEVARLTPSGVPVEVEPYRVGLEGRAQFCMQKLEGMGAGVGMLGLVGMGGVGKSTLAGDIYNRFVAAKKFRYMTFLEVDRDPLSSNVMVTPAWSKDLRKQLLWDLFRVRDDTSGDYSSWFRRVSTLGPVLIVVDDVQKLGQFEALIPFACELHPGSRIIVTSRDRSILNSVGGRTGVDHYLFDVATLGSDESNELFNWHYFQDREAPDDYKDAAKAVVEACGGLPLALKVIGSSLFDKRSDGDLESIWPEARDYLRQSNDVMSVLRWSYDNLPNAEKSMFVDVTCIFYKVSVKEALAYWRSCKGWASCDGNLSVETSLRNLVSKNLVTLSGDGARFEVHILLIELGQEIGMEAKTHFVKDVTCMFEKDKRGSSKKVREPRYSIQTRSAVDLMEDGYKRRKYGRKFLEDSPHSRSYYRCTTPKCPVRKLVERARDDPGLMTATYVGSHTHLSVAAASSNALSIQDLCNMYIKCGKFENFCNAEGIHGERLIEIGRGRLTAALFPAAFQRHLQSLMTSEICTAHLSYLLQEAANLVVKDLPYATKESQVGELSRSYQFFDEVDSGDLVDVDDVFSLGGLVAICQKFPYGEQQNLEDLGTNYSTEYCIVQHDLTGAYLCRRVLIQVLEDQLVENAVGVLGVEVTGKDIHVENIRDDGSYYSGTLKDFSYPFVLNNNGNSEAMEKQCATGLFGHVKGAEFLAGKEYGLKCSPLLAIALTIATQKKRTLALKWTRTYGHMEIDGLEHFMEFGKMKWQVLYTDKINQLGLDVEWGMEQVLKPYEMTNSQTSGTSNLQALASVFGNGVQQKRSVGFQFSLPGGVGIGGSIETYGSKGKELVKEAHPQIMEHLRRGASKFVETSDLDAEHAHVKDDLLQGRLPDAQHNYLVVWDDADNGHVSVYWAMDDGKLKWITDILLPCGKRDHKKLFRGGLRGLRMRVERDGSKLVSIDAHKPASDLISRFKKHKQLDIDSSMTQVPPGSQSNDEWVHLIGPQTKYSGNKFLWEATFMRAIISSRTSYLSGAMLDPYVLKDKFGEIGHCEKTKLDEIGRCNYASRLIHHTARVAAWGQYSKAPTSLVHGTKLIKWGGLVDENDLR